MKNTYEDKAQGSMSVCKTRCKPQAYVRHQFSSLYKNSQHQHQDLAGYLATGSLAYKGKSTS